MQKTETAPTDPALADSTTRPDIRRDRAEAAAALFISAANSAVEGRERALLANLFEAIFADFPQAIALLDAERRVIQANTAFENLFGYPADALADRRLADILAAPRFDSEDDTVAGLVPSNASARMKALHKHRDGRTIPVIVTYKPVVIGARRTAVLALYDDLRGRTHGVAATTRQPINDSLAGLLDRRQFEAECSRRTSHLDSLIYLSLDGFDAVNAACAHPAGDTLLAIISHRIRNTIHGSDLLTRFCGDEFALLLKDCPLQTAKRTASSIIKQIRDYRFHWNNRTYCIGASVGVVSHINPAGNWSQLLSAAEGACQTARSQGSDRVHVCRNIDTAQRHAHVDWVGRIDTAIRDDQFELCYQRIAPLNGGGEHAEILLRMLDSDGCVIAPGNFVPVAENNGLMPAIDRWVISAVFDRLILDRVLDGMLININISALTVGDEAIVDFIRDELVRTGIDRSRICFEITETAVVADLSNASKFVDDIHALGCKVALDDFGSGMASFQYLRSMQFDYLKIDGSFIRDLADSPVDQALTDAINRLARTLGIQTIAEYVENERIVEWVKKLKIDFLQGYGVHKPERW